MGVACSEEWFIKARAPGRDCTPRALYSAKAGASLMARLD